MSSSDSSDFTVLFQLLQDAKIDDQGHVSLTVNMSEDRVNFRQAVTDKVDISIPSKEVEAFIAGATVTITGVDGCCDGEIIITVLKTDGVYHQLVLDEYLERLHKPYIHWTDGGVYDDLELQELQDRVADEPTFFKDMEAGQRFALDMDGFVSLFAENLPRGFRSGLKCFQQLAKKAYTHVVEDA